tara:strand:- start:139 stop:420 length:282 start_codon:yes stop_codon:yes gene_type:complete
MAKKEKLVDLKPEKITDEQLQKLQSVVNNINRANIEIGRIESQKHRLLHDTVTLQQDLQNMQNEFETQYGSVNINIEDGSIKYPENGEVDKKD